MTGAVAASRNKRVVVNIVESPKRKPPYPWRHAQRCTALCRSWGIGVTEPDKTFSTRGNCTGWAGVPQGAVPRGARRALVLQDAPQLGNLVFWLPVHHFIELGHRAA